jgi:hypothetical protein
MTKNELYDLETEVHKNIDRIQREQAEYVKGVEDGIDLMFNAVRKHLTKEAETAAKKEQEEKDCSNCSRKGNGDVACKSCIASYDTRTNTSSTPSHWMPLPETPKGE